MKYSEAFDIAKSAIEFRKIRGHRYPDSAVRTVALEGVPFDNLEEAARVMALKMEEIERPFYSNPVWDGSIA